MTSSRSIDLSKELEEFKAKGYRFKGNMDLADESRESEGSGERISGLEDPKAGIDVDDGSSKVLEMSEKPIRLEPKINADKISTPVKENLDGNVSGAVFVDSKTDVVEGDDEKGSFSKSAGSLDKESRAGIVAAKKNDLRDRAKNFNGDEDSISGDEGSMNGGNRDEGIDDNDDETDSEKKEVECPFGRYS